MPGNTSATYIRFRFHSPPAILLPPEVPSGNFELFPEYSFGLTRPDALTFSDTCVYTVLVNQLEGTDLRVQRLDEILSQMGFFRVWIRAAVGHGVTKNQSKSSHSCTFLLFRGRSVEASVMCWSLELHPYPSVQVQMACLSDLEKTLTTKGFLKIASSLLAKHGAEIRVELQNAWSMLTPQKPTEYWLPRPFTLIHGSVHTCTICMSKTLRRAL